MIFLLAAGSLGFGLSSQTWDYSQVRKTSMVHAIQN